MAGHVAGPEATVSLSRFCWHRRESKISRTAISECRIEDLGSNPAQCPVYEGLPADRLNRILTQRAGAPSTRSGCGYAGRSLFRHII